MTPWSRRECLQAAFLAAAGGVLPARAQDATHVWLDMDQAALDDAYDQAVYAPNMALVLEQQTAMNAAAAARLGAPQRLSYGPGAIESVDVYRADVPAAPLHVFIHGGTWRFGTADEFAFVAEPFVNAGAHAVIVDFSSVGEAPEGLATLVRQVREAVAWVYRHAEELGGDPARLFVSGHSSGGHLAATVLTTDWGADFDLPPDVVRGGLCISGMFDLEPVRLSWRNEYLSLDPAEVEALSPQRRLEHVHAPIIVAYGAQETPEFQRQSREFAAALHAAGKRADLLVGQALNHFEILGTLANPYGLVGRAALAQMGLV